MSVWAEVKALFRNRSALTERQTRVAKLIFNWADEMGEYPPDLPDALERFLYKDNIAFTPRALHSTEPPPTGAAKP